MLNKIFDTFGFL